MDRRRPGLALLASLVLSACALSPLTPSPAPPKTQVLTPIARAALTLLYPKPDTVVQMGQGLKLIVDLAGDHDLPLPTHDVSLAIFDPSGSPVASIPAEAGPGDVYRSQAWQIPHRSRPGTWTVHVDPAGPEIAAVEIGRFEVVPSTSEVLLQDYGFWIDPPSLRGINLDLVAERGDANNGMIRLGGVLPSQHVLPEAWIEIHWRRSGSPVDDPASARRFLLEDIGDFGVTQVRGVGPFDEFRFRGWSRWRAMARGRVGNLRIEWVVFAAPEDGRSYAIGTTLVLPPVGIDPHALLRDSFEIPPEAAPAGVAPRPLLNLLPAPELTNPALGTTFEGTGRSIVLLWSPVRELGADEYYEVAIDYNYVEGNPLVRLATRSTHLVVPEALYHTPNCLVFNWEVRLMRQTGITGDGEPRGEPLSYRSFYWYFLWRHPAGEETFPLRCPNAQT